MANEKNPKNGKKEENEALDGRELMYDLAIDGECKGRYGSIDEVIEKIEGVMANENYPVDEIYIGRHYPAWDGREGR